MSIDDDNNEKDTHKINDDSLDEIVNSKSQMAERINSNILGKDAHTSKSTTYNYKTSEVSC